jgi:hypothetical protein
MNNEPQKEPQNDGFDAPRLHELMLITNPKGLNYESLYRIAQGKIDAAVQGYTSPIDKLAQLKALELYADAVRKGIMPLALREFEHVKEKNEVRTDLFSITPTTTGAVWDYSHDYVWVQLKANLDAAKKAVANREAFLRQIRENTTAVPIEDANPATGEVYIVRPAILQKSEEILRFAVVK